MVANSYAFKNEIVCVCLIGRIRRGFGRICHVRRIHVGQLSPCYFNASDETKINNFVFNRIRITIIGSSVQSKYVLKYGSKMPSRHDHDYCTAIFKPLQFVA